MKFNQKHKEVIDKFLLKRKGITEGKMFGYPAYYINKKLFACLYAEGVGIKVPEELVKKLIGKDGIKYFQPMGKSKMREWIQLNRKKSEEYLKDINIFNSSIEFVSSISKKVKQECKKIYG